MLRIEMLPAAEGDCLLIEYGRRDRPRRVLVDGGTPATLDTLTDRLSDIGNVAKLELLVVTHVDKDHIGGVLALLDQDPVRVQPSDVWFNAYKHLLPDRAGPAQGEGLSTAIERNGFPWNQRFRGSSVVIPDDGDLPTAQLAGGATITLLSPGWRQLENMVTTWKRAVKKAGLVPGEGAEPSDVLGKRPPPRSLDIPALARARVSSDRSKANASSIAFLFEYAGKRLLFAADAHASVLAKALKRYSEDPVELDAFKLSHHGSGSNLSATLLKHIKCDKYLVSTSGAVHGHPHAEALARLIATEGHKKLYFNYENEYTTPYAKRSLRDRYDYDIRYPDDDGVGVVLEL